MSMKHRPALGAVLLATAFLAGGCFNREFFDKTTIESYNLSEGDLKDIQYYTTSTLTLEYENTRSRSVVTSGNRVENEKENFVNLIVKPGETKGKAISVGANEIVIDVSHGLNLGFRPTRVSPDGRYLLDSINGQPVRHNGTILYRGKMYRVLFGEYASGNTFKRMDRPQLQYDLRSVQKHRRKVEVVEGSEPDAARRRS